jgi:hypothetical protein
MQTTFNASADAVWATISDFNSAPQYIAAILTSTLEGSGVGALRTLTLRDGVQVVERLESLEPQARTLSYSIVSGPVPLTGYVSTMRVRDLGNGQCALDWSATFAPRGVPEADASTFVEGVYRAGFAGLKKLHNG